MSYQWYSEVIFIIVVMSILGITVYTAARVVMKFLMLAYDRVRGYTEKVLENIKYHRHR